MQEVMTFKSTKNSLQYLVYLCLYS